MKKNILLTFYLFSISLLLFSCTKNNPPAFMQLQWKTPKGEIVKLNNYKNQWILINYWATWCPPCIHEMPDIQSFYQQAPKNKLIAIGISFDEAKTKKQLNNIQIFADKLGIKFPIVLPSGKEQELGISGLQGLPTNIIINPQQQITYNQVGPINFKKLTELIQFE